MSLLNFFMPFGYLKYDYKYSALSYGYFSVLTINAAEIKKGKDLVLNF